MRILILLLAASLYSGLANADDASCQSLIDKVASGLAAANKMSAADPAAKCHAYMQVYLTSLDVASACNHNQEDLNLMESTFKPLMDQLARAEQSFCGA